METWKRNLAMMCFVQFGAGISLSFIFSFIPLYLPYLGIEGTDKVAVWSGILMAAAPLMAAFLGPVWGNLGDKYGLKLMVERVLLSNIVVLISMGFVTNAYQLLGLRLLQGMLGGFGSATIALVTSFTPQEKTGSALGIYQTATIAGTATGPFIGGILADSFGYRFPFFFMSLVTFTSLLVMYFQVQEPPRGGAAKKNENFLKSLSAVAHIPGLMPIAFINFLIQFGLMVVAPIVPLFVKSLAVSDAYVATVTGTVLALAGGAAAISSTVSGRLGDRLGYRTVLIALTIGTAIMFGLTALTYTLIAFAATRIAAGLFIGGLMPTSNALISRFVTQDKRGMAFGVTTSMTLFGTVAGPLAGGWLSGWIGLRSTFFVTMAMFLAAALWVWTHNPQTQEGETES
ncbi:MFS transporter [Effusibacillus lacus]|uniref:MFS transporter n=1 Tax=Effusibacillus lacus TaxID=1348429 RepID=A0A292YSN0_9BACL|nr:MFS transporter [Effusibacillus lacus]TCS76379.1 DHA1 family multidrug resistance protein-like MFS transporter [Effusibacillus lacus]GAX91921.1 MFS transporter [Effusibacillus lacus]